jgi:hypothetical protein
MTDDLEAEIRDALHSRAQQVTEGDLHRARAVQRLRLLPALAAAAVVAALAAGIAIWNFGTGGSAGRPAAAGRVPSGLVGVMWRLDFVHEGGPGAPDFAGTPPGVSIVFYRSGTFVANDSVNDYSGNYRITGNQLVASDTMGSLVGTSGGDPALNEVLGAMSAVMSGRPVGVRITDGRLILKVEPYLLVFDRAGAAAEPSPVVGSTTPVSTPTATPSYVNGSELPS